MSQSKFEEKDIPIDELRWELKNKKAEFEMHALASTLGKTIAPRMIVNEAGKAEAVLVMVDMSPEQAEEKSKFLSSQIDLLEWNIKLKHEKHRLKKRKENYKNEYVKKRRRGRPSKNDVLDENKESDGE